MSNSEEYTGRKFKTNFLSNNFSHKFGEEEEKLVRELINYSKILSEKKLTANNSGNISVRTNEGLILITAGGVDKGNLTPDDIVKIVDYNKNKNTIFAIGSKEPSSEARMHYMIYQKFQIVRAIVHVHDELALKNENITHTKKEEPYGTIGLANEVISALKLSDYIIIKNHGVVAIGKNLDEAVKLVLNVHV